MNAASYGCKTYKATTVEELKAALEDAEKQTVSTLIDIKVLPKTMLHGYGHWWRVGQLKFLRVKLFVRHMKHLK